MSVVQQCCGAWLDALPGQESCGSQAGCSHPSSSEDLGAGSWRGGPSSVAHVCVAVSVLVPSPAAQCGCWAGPWGPAADPCFSDGAVEAGEERCHSAQKGPSAAAPAPAWALWPLGRSVASLQQLRLTRPQLAGSPDDQAASPPADHSAPGPSARPSSQLSPGCASLSDGPQGSWGWSHRGLGWGRRVPGFPVAWPRSPPHSGACHLALVLNGPSVLERSVSHPTPATAAAHWAPQQWTGGYCWGLNQPPGAQVEL